MLRCYSCRLTRLRYRFVYTQERLFVVEAALGLFLEYYYSRQATPSRRPGDLVPPNCYDGDKTRGGLTARSNWSAMARLL